MALEIRLGFERFEKHQHHFVNLSDFLPEPDHELFKRDLPFAVLPLFDHLTSFFLLFGQQLADYVVNLKREANLRVGFN
jgi:hypothetical protein